MNVLFVDTETGGIPEGVSILSIALTLYNFERHRITQLDELNLWCKPNDNLYVIDPEALKVNGIDLAQHREKALSYKDTGTAIYEFLQKAYKYENRKPTVAGQGVQFDLDHIWRSGIISKAVWREMTDIRLIDVIGIAKLCVLEGLIPPGQSLSLGKLAEHLGIETDYTQLHTANYDNEVAALVLNKLRLMLRENSI
jgi:DNA polymerase III epsilon subunit-like protein